jgi:hypothetical protein
MKQRAINIKTKMAEAADVVGRGAKLARAVKALVLHLDDPKKVKEPRLGDFGLFTDEQERSIWMVARKEAKFQAPFDYAEFVKQMDKTTPVLARPRITERLVDLWRMLALPEIAEGMWPAWNAKTGSRGQHPGFWAKAILVMTAALGISAHFDDNHAHLFGGEGRALRALFSWIEQTASMAVGRDPEPLGRKSYEQTCTQINLITDPELNPGALTVDRANRINAKLYRCLQLIYPQFGKHLSLDGMLVKGWVEQTTNLDRISKKAPNATARLIQKRKGRKGRKGGPGRFVVGYYLVVLCDLATGIPVAWRILPAGKGYRDYDALMTLLDDLFRADPDFPVETIVADMAWNKRKMIRDCALRYGIHLLSDLSQAQKRAKQVTLRMFDSNKVASFDRWGRCYCRQHGLDMKRVGVDFVGRAQRTKLGLKPGEVSKGTFRVRFKCPVGGGVCDQRADMPMWRDWQAFSYYPHTMDTGRPDLQAFRLAMYARRNTSEAIFGALKLGHKLGLESADRTHTANENTMETLLSLGLLMRTAFVVASERIKRGEMPADPPPDLLAELR